MKPKFMEHIHIDIPKDLTPEFDEFGDMTVSAINQMIVQQVESIDDKICKEIHDMAVSNGIDDVYLLDKKQILSALEKQIPKKPTHEATLYRNLTCPNCKNVVDEFIEFIPNQPKVRVTTNHCKYCGQALDWSDTE